MLESPAACFAFRYGALLNMTARLSVVFPPSTYFCAATVFF